MNEQPKVFEIVTVPETAYMFLRDKLRHLRDAGYDAHLVSSPGQRLNDTARHANIQAHEVKMEREIQLVRDATALLRLVQLLGKERPTIVHAATPKAALLGMLAAKLTRTPVRVYSLFGLRLETTHGPKRLLLLAVEKLTCACAHHVVCISPSLRDQVVRLKIVPAHKTSVVGAGSAVGIDLREYDPPEVARRAEELRIIYGIPSDSPVVGFVGRLVRDKGIVELAEAFRTLRSDIPGLKLLLIGDFEDDSPLPDDIQDFLLSDSDVVHVGWVDDPKPFYPLMDVLAHPTHREGFGTVLLEAAAARKPTVTTNATGAVDAVVANVTGLVVDVGNVRDLAAALKRVLSDRTLAASLGMAGHARVARDFKPERIWRGYHDLYEYLLRRTRHRHALLKRCLDVIVAATGLLLAAPVMLLVALAIHLTMGGPVLFRQVRPGMNGRLFTLYKFRTMLDLHHDNGQPLTDAQRLTPVGRFLRRMSLDELPQLVNVLKGEMSLVGPRPLLREYLPRYSPRQARRHDVRPGITGWAQVHGRNALSWPERFDLDVWYVEHHSLLLDVRILFMTIAQVLRSENINFRESDRPQEFLGEPEIRS